MTKEFFWNLLKQIRNAECFTTEAYKLRIDMAETPLYESYGWLLDRVLEQYFDREGIEHIYWFMFEHHNIALDFDNDLNMLEPGQLYMTDIPMNTIEDLWTYIQNYIKD